MKSPGLATVKRLFAISGNRCSFPRCPLPIIDNQSGKPVGRVCHIRAKNQRGPPYDRNQTDSERHAFENLILLCPIHHDVIDADEETYTVERLLSMRADHEAQNDGGQDPPDDLAKALIACSEVEITEGSILLSLQQSGGQVAHSITNMYGVSDEAARRIHEKQIEVFANLWQKITETNGCAEQIALGLLHVPSLNDMSDRQVDAFVKAQAAMKEWEKDELRAAADKRRYYCDWYWWWLATQARERWRDLYRYIKAIRIFLDDGVKAQLAEATTIMSQIIVLAEIAKSYTQQNFEKSDALNRQLQSKMTELEQAISVRLRGGNS